MTSLLDHSNQDLRGRSFRDAALDGADFSGADLRSADFTNASLVKADFTNARFGLRPLAGAILLAAAMAISALAGRSTAYFMQSTRERLTSGGDWQDGLASILMLIVIATFLAILVMRGARIALPSLAGLIATAFLVDVVIVMFLGRLHFDRAPMAIALMLMAGLAFVAGILGRIVGGAFGAWAIGLISIVGGLVAGSVEGGFAGVLVATLLVVMSKRTLKGDSRDRMLRDLSHRIVSRYGTRFTGADLSRATFAGNNLVAADMTGTVDEGTVWGPGQVPYRLDAPTRFFGDRPAGADDEPQGDRPITEFIFEAANSGDYSAAAELVSKDFVAYINGLKMGGGHAPTSGPDLLASILRFFDGQAEGAFWRLYDEVDGGTGHGASGDERRIAIRFVASGTFDGDYKEIEVAGFLKITDKKMTELRFVTDLRIFNEMRETAGLETLA